MLQNSLGSLSTDSIIFYYIFFTEGISLLLSWLQGGEWRGLSLSSPRFWTPTLEILNLTARVKVASFYIGSSIFYTQGKAICEQMKDEIIMKFRQFLRNEVFNTPTVIH